MGLHRVFFDTNDGNPEWGYELNFPRSKDDLKRIGPDVCDGMRIIIYMPDELEVEANLKYDDKLGCWKAMPDMKTVKYLDGS